MTCPSLIFLEMKWVLLFIPYRKRQVDSKTIGMKQMSQNRLRYGWYNYWYSMHFVDWNLDNIGIVGNIPTNENNVSECFWNRFPEAGTIPAVQPKIS